MWLAQVTLNSVSCAPVGNCSAVGFYTDGSAHQQGLLLNESGGLHRLLDS
jgi:hypothetical protein